jgi:hypothetical protein
VLINLPHQQRQRASSDPVTGPAWQVTGTAAWHQPALLAPSSHKKHMKPSPNSISDEQNATYTGLLLQLLLQSLPHSPAAVLSSSAC